MRCKRRISLHAFGLLIILFACSHAALFAQSDDPLSASESLQRMRAEEEARRVTVLEKLNQPVSVDASGTPLNEVLNDLASDIGLEVAYDQSALRVLGIDAELEPCDLVIEGVPAKSVLQLILGELGLTWDIRAGRIFVTSIEKAQEYLSVRVYNVTDRVVSLESGRLLCSESDMVDMITEVIEPESWDSWGGPGTIDSVSVNRRVLISVRQRTPVLIEIEELLAELRRMDQPDADRSSSSWIAEDVAMMERLERPLEKLYEDVPLEEVGNDMRYATVAPTIFDVRALRELGIDPEIEPIDLDCLTMNVGEALDFILQDLGLTYTLRNGVLLITSIDQAQEYLTTRIYDVTNVMGGRESDIDLIDMVREIVEPESWDSWGGPGTVELIEQEHGWFLVVRQTWAVHRDLERFLSDLEMRALDETPYEDEQWQALLDQVEAERMERIRLAEEVRNERRLIPNPPSPEEVRDPLYTPREIDPSNPFGGNDPFGSPLTGNEDPFAPPHPDSNPFGGTPSNTPEDDPFQ